MVSGATATLRKFDDRRFGVLVVPGAHNNPEELPLVPGKWAMDNGAYSGLDKVAFLNMLERYQGQAGCLWVAAPDVVGDAISTLGKWKFWSRLIKGVGFPPALVAQDGLTVPMVPWDDVGGLFIGGTTEFKLSNQARELVAYAKARGIPTHMGRVNGRSRMRMAARWGVDSIDGSSRSMFPETQMGLDIAWLNEMARQPELMF